MVKYSVLKIFQSLGTKKKEYCSIVKGVRKIFLKHKKITSNILYCLRKETEIHINFKHEYNILAKNQGSCRIIHILTNYLRTEKKKIIVQ